MDWRRSSLALMSCSVVVVVVVVGGGAGVVVVVVVVVTVVVVVVVEGLLAVEDLSRVVVALLSRIGAVGMNGIGVCSLLVNQELVLNFPPRRLDMVNINFI